MTCENCPNCDCPPCDYDVAFGPATPVALVCNLIPDTDNPEDPLCLTCCGTMCYKQEAGDQEVETVPNNAWTQVVTNQTTQYQQVLTGGDVVTFTMEHLTPPGGGNIAGIDFTAITPAPIDDFRLTWDQPLVGQFTLLLDNVDVGPIFNIVPAPDAVNPAFGPGGTHQLVWNDITGITQIDFNIDATVPGADVINFSIDESVPLTHVTFVEADTREFMLMMNICVDPPTMRYIDLSTGEEETDPDVIAGLYNCDIDYVEEEVCVTIDGETFTCIKRTLYASPPVDVFIGQDGVVVEPDSWVPGQCDFQMILGHVLDCNEENVLFEPLTLAQFTDAPIGTNQIIFSDEIWADTIRRGITNAQDYQSQQELHGIPIASVIFNVGVNVYAFRPDALLEGTGTTFEIDEAGVIAWDPDVNTLIDEVRYTIFVDCDCRGVEIFQWVKDSNEVQLLDVFDLAYDQGTRLKTSILTDGLTDFNTLGPYAGPCAPAPEEDNIFSWTEPLCDIQITVDEVTLVVTDTVINSVNRVNGLTGAILETHTIGGSVQWTAGSFYDHNAGLYYVYDNNSGDWHRYNVFNLAAGSTNLGAFGGAPIVGGLTFGTFDPSNGRGYVGRQDDTLYEIDPTLLTVTALPSITGLLDLLEAPSSLYLDNVGRFIFMSIGTGALLGTNRVYELDITTGVATYIADLPPGITLNGGGYDLTNNSGFYGVSSGAQILYRWTNLDASNITTVGTPGTAPTSGTMDVVNSITSAEVIAEFQRVYHKNLSTGEVTSQDHDLEDADYEVIGTVEHCPVEVESSIETTCDDPLHVQQCIETWSERLCDVGFLEVLGEDQVFIEIAPQVSINQGAQLVGFSGGEGPVTGIVEAVFAVEPDVQYDYIAGHGGAGTCPGGPAAILVEIIDDSGAGAVLASQTLQYVGGVDPQGVDLGPTTMPFTSTTGNVMVRVSDQTPVTTICDAIFYWYDLQSTNVIRTEFQRVYHKNLQTLNITAQDHDFRGNLYELYGTAMSCQYVTWSELLCDENCVTFNRVYHKSLTGETTYQDHDLIGTPYIPVGEVDICINCCSVESHLIELNTGETWTPASIPADHVVTGLSINTIVEAPDSDITDADGVSVTNIPAGLSMSWNASQDHNTLVPPQSISAGTGGRMIINVTMRDESP